MILLVAGDADERGLDLRRIGAVVQARCPLRVFFTGTPMISGGRETAGQRRG